MSPARVTMTCSWPAPSPTAKLGDEKAKVGGVGEGEGVGEGVGVGVGVGVAFEVPMKMRSWLLLRLLMLIEDGEKVKPALTGVTV